MNKRLYVEYSSVFNNLDRHYNIPLIKAALKEVGAKNVRTANQFGWSNQPKVITFTGISADKARTRLQFVLNTPWILVSKKDW